MTNSKTTRRALVSSAVAIVLCLAMLIGSTFAWFTDTASTGVNKIQAGNLKMEVTYRNGDSEGVLDEHTNVFMENALWEPGHVEYAVLNVKNVGTLALKYKLGINIASETGSTNVLGTEFKLSDYIRYAVLEGDRSTTDRAQLVADAAGTSQLINVATSTEESHLDTQGASETVTLVVWMPETVGNEANHAADAAAPVINLGINVYATQYTYESDSFDDQYDKDAPYVTVNVTDEQELRTALYNAPTNGDGVKIVLQDDITLEMLYAAENFGTDTIKDNEIGDTLNRYKLGVHPTADDPTHWNPLVTNQTQEEKEAYGAYFHTGAGDERIARLVVKAGQDVIIDLNGHNLSKDARATHGDWTDVCTSLIGNYGTLSIIDSEGTGLITGSGMKSCAGGVIHNYGGTLTIRGAMIDGGAAYTDSGLGQYVIVNGDQSAPTLYKNGTIILDGAFIYDGATSASLICNNVGTMTIKNGTELKHINTKVINCKGGEVFVESAMIKSKEYAIYAKGGTVTVTDSAVTINGAGTMTEDGGTIIHK